MPGRLWQLARSGLFIVLMTVFAPLGALAAPYAALVMDARSGEVLHARNADTRLHPASLTKMMTLYIVFEAVEHGEIGLDSLVTISQKAASEPPSKLGLKPGQKIKLRYLIRAAAVKSANDAATALGEAIEGSEAAFARRMNRTAKALGMTRTTFKNANGLTESGHLSTARDMTILGRHLLYDYPQYYNLFSRRQTDAGTTDVANTNRRFLENYPGADGIKTGYTRAAGFNLVASAERGNKRIIATVFGGRSSAQRNAQVAELLDLGFGKAPTRVAVSRPATPSYGNSGDAVGRIVNADTAVTRSPRPVPRPGTNAPAPSPEVLVAMAETIDKAVTAAAATGPATGVPVPDPGTEVASAAPAPISTPLPLARPETPIDLAVADAAALAAAPDPEPERIVVTRISTSGERLWGINVGRYASRYQAEQVLLKTALSELNTLDEALRKVAHSKLGFDANFVGMTRDGADRACARLNARNIECKTLGPT